MLRTGAAGLAAVKPGERHCERDAADSGRVRCSLAVVGREAIRAYVRHTRPCGISTMMNDVRGENGGIYRRWHSGPLAIESIASDRGEP